MRSRSSRLKHWVIELLRCPVTGANLHLANGAIGSPEESVESGALVTEEGSHRYEIAGGVPRFVPRENYAASFGFQWNRFRRSQLDSYSGVPISRERFFGYSGWRPEDLKGRLVLDVGCGAGRFTEVALDCGARVVALDYSSAVDACYANHHDRDGFAVMQADVYQLPLAAGSFDFVYCFGVLQHTPDVGRAFRALPRMLAPGGRLAIDVYPKLWRNLLWTKYWLRPLTSRVPPQKLFESVQRWTPGMLRASAALTQVPVVGGKLRYILPVANYAPDYPLSESQLQEWAVLDTFDMLSPAHDHPQSLNTVRQWLQEAELEDIWVSRMGFNVGRGRRPKHGSALAIA
jgi:2-polyprenyl-3-methyl-5-hydroxy-6-metoxy-1,4-benzoquinol methylase